MQPWNKFTCFKGNLQLRQTEAPFLVFEESAAAHEQDPCSNLVLQENTSRSLHRKRGLLRRQTELASPRDSQRPVHK